MWSHERCYEIVEKYNIKVKTYIKRKRGNPPDVLKAMKIIRGMIDETWCEVCGKVGRVQLNHLKHWQDYRIEFLRFECSKCHTQFHREVSMSNRINWAKHGGVLVNFVNTSGLNVTQAIKKFHDNIREGLIDGIDSDAAITTSGLESAFYKYRNESNAESVSSTGDKISKDFSKTMNIKDVYELNQLIKALRKIGVTVNLS